MRLNIYLSILGSAVAGGLLLAGCGQQETSAPASSSQPATPVALPNNQSTSERPAAQVTPAPAPAIPAPLPVETAKAVETPKVPEAITPTAASAQSILARARTLVGEKKYPEALAALSELSSISLTAEQQQLASQLKAQIQSALAAQGANEGAKALGGLLNQTKQ